MNDEPTSQTDFSPWDKLLRRLKIAFYSSEATMLAYAPIAAVSTVEMFRNVWNHNVPAAVLDGANVLVAGYAYSKGYKTLQASVDHLAEISHDIGTMVALNTGMTRKVALAFCKKRPSMALVQYLGSRAPKNIHVGPTNVALIAGMVDAGIGNVALRTGMLGHLDEALIGAGLISMVVHHRLARTRINNANDLAMREGFATGAELNDMHSRPMDDVGMPRFGINVIRLTL
jgi:hypothetical protein